MDYIITIGREYGSGGNEIGELLAKKLGISFYNKELIAVAASQSGISEDLFYQNDESQPGSFIYSLVMGTYPIIDGNTIYSDLPMNHKIFLAQFDAIKSIAKKGPCVIVGRCADYVLQDYPKLIKVFITADLDFRAKRAIERDNIPPKKAEDYVKKLDKKRASHYRYYTEKKWGSANNYDICINSNKLGIDGTVNLLLNYIENKQK